MHNLLSIIKALSKSQLKSLEKYLNSPYYVTHAGVGQLFSLLKNADPETLKELKSEQFQKNTDPKKLYYHTNYLLEATEKFLALQQWESEPHRQQAATVEALRRLGLPDSAVSMLRYARKQLEKDTHRGLNYLEADFKLIWEGYQLSLQQGRAKSFSGQEISDTQDLAFICAKLRTGCLLLSHQSVSKQTYDKGMLEQVLQMLNSGHPSLNVPIIAAYYHGYYAQLGAVDSNLHFSKLKTLLQGNAQLFPMAEMHDLYLMAINFCIRKINQQEPDYYREIFELYQSGLQHGALLEDGILSRWTYNNITSSGLRLREFDRVWAFIHQYEPLLAPEHRSGALNFNLARYHYEKGEPKEAMQHLLHIEYDDVLQNLTAKTLLAKIYYQLEEMDALENQLDTIIIYVRRKKVLGYHRDNYLEFVKYTRKLLAVKWANPKERTKLKAEIMATPRLMEKEWLLGELKE